MPPVADLGTLVGRGPALAAGRAALAAAAAGRGRLLLVAGEAGIGKTALVQRLAAEAGDADALVLWGQCWTEAGAPAYWPWVQVLRAATAAGAEPGAAVALLPETPAPAPDAGRPGTDGALFRLYDAVVAAVAGLSARRVVVVVLDDLQWADEGSLRLLEFAARHLAVHRVLLVGTYREEEAGAALRRLVRGEEHLLLPALSTAQVAGLMASVAGREPSDSVAETVRRRTAGNPFLVRELTRLAVAQGDDVGSVPPSTGLSETVRDVVERRLARLPQRCTELLVAAAVAGPEVRPEVLARLPGEESDLAQLLEAAVRARVLVPPPAPLQPYRFAHDLFRETMVTGLSTADRCRLHLALGHALEARRREGARVHPAELALHFTAALPADPGRAHAYAREAGDAAAARLAPDEARAHYERALSALDLCPDVPAGSRLELLLRLADARCRDGDAPGARAAYRVAAELARETRDAAALAEVAVGVHGLGSRDSHAESIRLLTEAAAALREQPCALRARVLAALARDLHHSVREQDWDRAVALAEDAVALARRLDDPDTLVPCLLALHDARWRPGSAADRLAVADEMLASVAAGDADAQAQARLLRAGALLELGDRRGVAELEEYCRCSEELRHARGRYGALSRRATLALLRGDVAEAQDLAERAFDLGRSIGEPDARGVRETLLWGARRVSGGGAVPPLVSDPWPGLPLARAVVLVASGDVEAAAEALTGLDVRDLPVRHDLEMLAFLTEVVAAAGTHEQRAALYELLRPFAGTHVVVGGCASYFGATDQLLGHLAQSLGLPGAAHRHFSAAAAQHEALGAAVWARASRAAADGTSADTASGSTSAFLRVGAVWRLEHAGTVAHAPDSKGMRDLAVLLERPGEDVSAVELYTGRPSASGADAVLDADAKSAYRRRLAELDADLDRADVHGDVTLAARARAERKALLHELSAAVGLGGRDRRLGDERERARKAVSARIRDAVGRIGEVHPVLGEHLTAAVRTGTWCAYVPTSGWRWTTTRGQPVGGGAARA